MPKYTGINCLLSSDEDNCIVKGDIKKTEDIEGSCLRNTKGLVLF